MQVNLALCCRAAGPTWHQVVLPEHQHGAALGVEVGELLVPGGLNIIKGQLQGKQPTSKCTS